jgi:hypothetical protein
MSNSVSFTKSPTLVAWRDQVHEALAAGKCPHCGEPLQLGQGGCQSVQCRSQREMDESLRAALVAIRRKAREDAKLAARLN